MCFNAFLNKECFDCIISELYVVLAGDYSGLSSEWTHYVSIMILYLYFVVDKDGLLFTISF
jgi:hypothetical protein